jgi:hypothetical protein
MAESYISFLFGKLCSFLDLDPNTVTQFITPERIAIFNKVVMYGSISFILLFLMLSVYFLYKERKEINIEFTKKSDWGYLWDKFLDFCRDTIDNFKNI